MDGPLEIVPLEWDLMIATCYYMSCPFALIIIQMFSFKVVMSLQFIEYSSDTTFLWFIFFTLPFRV